MYANECAAPSVSPVEARFRELDEALNILTNVVDRLDSRLSYVIGPRAPQPGGTSAGPTAVPVSPMEGGLEATIGRVRAEAARVNDLIDRLRI